jgi:diguanylate cyclase (GGDEF)-like protein/PAS domain S-box-containing protein
MDDASSDNRRVVPGVESDYLQTLKKQLHDIQEENRELSDLFEETISRANTLTMEVEIARLEFEQVFNSVGDATWVINERFGVIRINRAFLDLLGIKEKEAALNKKCFDLFPSLMCKTSTCPLEQIRRKKQRMEIELVQEIKPAKTVPFLLTAMPLFGLAGELVGIVEQFKDITQIKNYQKALEKANIELEQLATVDGLTQLANRRVFDEKIGAEWNRMRREKKPFSLILCDIDFFKNYNDHYGHQKGDECLQGVAARIKACVRRPADLVARYGGEEFAVLLPDTPFEGGYHLAEKIREAVWEMKREHLRSEAGDRVTLSLGIATLLPSDKTKTPEDLLKAADTALYTSKKEGRNRVSGNIQ